MNGYIPIRVMIPIGQPNGGTFADLWQVVEDGKQTKVVTLEGVEVEVPEIHEAIALSRDLHFAPGVLRDPDAYVPPSIADVVAALKAGPDVYAKLVEKAQADEARVEAKVEVGALTPGGKNGG